MARRRSSVAVQIEYDLLDPKARSSVANSAARLLGSIDPVDGAEPVRIYRSLVWPDLNRVKAFADINPQLVLLPLNRLGVPQGMSGSHVLVGYFVDTGAKKLAPSHPMVVKVNSPEQRNGRDTLREEKRAADEIRAHIYANRERFALPIWFDEASSRHPYSVLWAPFSTSYKLDRVFRQARLPLREIQDLLSLLQGNASHKAGKSIRETYGLLKELHARHGEQQRNLYDEYAWYLRGVDAADGWGSRWRAIWGNAPETEDLSRMWANPFVVLDRIRALPEASLSCGAIHGDLHPRNVILGQKSEPFLIDYGWARDCQHVAKDFALLECNLRFVTLPPDSSEQDLLAMCRWNSMLDVPPSVTHPACTARCELIRIVRRSLASVVAKPPRGVAATELFWLKEYLIPLYLVALGLFQHLPSYSNQIAARFTVLSLATYINGLLSELEAWLKAQAGASGTAEGVS